MEFLVELGGRKRDCGVDATIGDRTGRIGLRNIVEPYEAGRSDERLKTEEELVAERLDALRRAIGGLRYEAVCDRTAGGRWTLRLGGRARHRDARRPRPLRGRGAGLAGHGRDGRGAHARAARAPQHVIRPLRGGRDPVLRGRRVAAGPLSVRFAVIAELTGAPEGRAEHVLASILSDRASLIRFLLLLLGNLDEALDAPDPGVGAAGHGEWLTAFESGALLEPLVRAYARDPDRLREIERVMGEIARSGHGRGLLPAGWDAIWAPIAAALGGEGAR